MKNPVQPFYRFGLSEMMSPKIWVSAFLIGGSINWFGTGDFFATPMGFIIPYLVQAFSRASVRYKNRFQSLLALLPQEREDPAFVMSESGEIMLSMGKTKIYFAEQGVTSINEYLGDHVVEAITVRCELGGQKNESLEFYSKVSARWYSLKVKCLEYVGGGRNFLVWLDDISATKRLFARIISISSYSDQLIQPLDDITEKTDVYQRMAPFILGMGFEAVFIAQKGLGGSWSGQASRYQEGELLNSGDIGLEFDSSAPILLSRTQKKLIQAAKKPDEQQADFEAKYPFDARIKEFVPVPINDFVNYHAGDISIIAFNKKGVQDQEDEFFLRTLVNNSRSLFYLAGSALINEEQFLQKLMGLCVAAEFSDETTGSHLLRVNRFCRMLASQLGLGAQFVRTISQVAALHDIGKVAILGLIQMSGIYDPDQREQMQMHTLHGAQILRAMLDFSGPPDEKFEMAYNIALHHHQAYNGTGYPRVKQDGVVLTDLTWEGEPYRSLEPLLGEEIPLEALITGLADSYDALRSTRLYREPYSHEEALALLAKDDRTGVTGEERFGPSIWGAFMQIEPKFAKVYQELT